MGDTTYNPYTQMQFYAILMGGKKAVFLRRMR